MYRVYGLTDCECVSFMDDDVGGDDEEREERFKIFAQEGEGRGR